MFVLDRCRVRLADKLIVTYHELIVVGRNLVLTLAVEVDGVLGTLQFTDALRLYRGVVLPVTTDEILTRAPRLMRKIVGLLGLLQQRAIGFLEELWRVHSDAFCLTIVEDATLECLRRERVGLILRRFGKVILVLIEHGVKVNRHTEDFFPREEDAGETEERLAQGLCKCTLVHVFLLCVHLLIVTHDKLYGHGTDHRDLIACDGAEILRRYRVEIRHDVRDGTRRLILHHVLTRKAMGETAKTHTAHGGIVEVVQGIVGRDDM